MGFKNVITKFGLIIVAILTVLLFFLPLILISSNTLQITVDASMFYTNVVDPLEYGFFQSFYSYTAIFNLLGGTYKTPTNLFAIFGIMTFFILIIVGPTLLIISCFTRSRPRLTKILVAIGFGFSCMLFIGYLGYLTSYLDAFISTPLPFIFFDGTIISGVAAGQHVFVVPHYGFYIALGNLAFGAFIIKLTDWEDLN